MRKRKLERTGIKTTNEKYAFSSFGYKIKK